MSDDLGVVDWKTRTFVIGGVLGALVGLGAAYILIRNAEKQGEAPEIPPGRAVALGVTVLGLLRQIASLGED